MFRALGARLTLDHKRVSGVALFEATAQRSWLWGTTGLKTATDLFAEGEVQEGGVSVNALRCDAGNRSLCRIAVHRPDTWDPSTLWLTTVDIVRTDDSVEVGVSVEQDMSHHRVPPSPLHPPLVDLLHDLVAGGATAGTQRVHSTTESVVGSEQIDALVQGCLLDPGRRLPVVLFSANKEQDGTYPPDAGDPALTARELCGLAHIYVMPRVEDSHRLTKRLHMLSVYDGAVRIYWPRLRLTDPPPRHPLHLRQRLNTGSGPAIIRRVVEAGARSYRPPEGTLTLLATRWRDREVDRIRVITSDPDPIRQASLLRDELLRAIDSNVTLEHEMDALRHQLMMSTDRSDRLEAELAVLRGVVDASTELTGRPAPSRSDAAAPNATDIST
ncbi:MAG TPA: hypothetical protein VMU65_06505 [Candidatus Saccharimonadales bacterium]|nr:hypothetical protein [Candidatus Saccharimonadales bacterium]